MIVNNKKPIKSNVKLMENGDQSADHSIATILSVHDLSFSYGNVPVLRNINLEMLKGGITCLMGRNGVGKTTLIKNIMGLLSPRRGAVHLKNQDVSEWDVSNVENMNGMFGWATLFNANLSDWDVSKVTDMALTFNRQLHNQHGQLSIGVLLFQDLVAVVAKAGS